MISLYSCYGKHKRIGKFKDYWNCKEYIKKRFGSNPYNPILKNYFIKETKN